MKRTTTAAAALVIGAAVMVPAAPAMAADFCASRISGTTYYQKDFSYNGSVAATICGPGYNRSGNVYLYARGSYANVSKYMKITIQTRNVGTVSADGNFYSYVYRAAPAGAHAYTAVMKNSAGKTIVNGTGADYE